MNSVEKRSVPERKSKILQFYNGWPGLAGQAGSPRVAWAWRHHTRPIGVLWAWGTKRQEGGQWSGRAQMPREISSNSLFLRNDLLNFKVDANELFLWVTLSFTIFESRLTWNTTDSIDPWDGLCTCRHHSSGGEILPHWTQWPISIHPGAVCHPGPPSSGVTRPPKPDSGWMGLLPGDIHR